MSESLKTVAISAIVAMIVVVGFGMVGGNQSDQNLGGTRFPSGISADSTSPSAGQVRGTTLISTGAMTVGGTLGVTGVATFSADPVVTTTNSATSSITVGCIDTYATSTDTAIRLSATTTPGIAYWSYGACSGL